MIEAVPKNDEGGRPPVGDEWSRLIRYIDGVRPGFATRVRPASADQISRYEAVIGRPMFVPYRRFLERMGESDDGLFEEFAGFSATIEDLIDSAVRLRDEDFGPSFFDSYLQIGVAMTQVYGLRVSGPGAGRVVVLAGGGEDTRYGHRADSLVTFAYSCGFAHEASRLSTRSAVLTADAGRKDDLLRHVRGRYEASEYSDSVRWYGRREGVLLVVTTVRGRGLEAAFTSREPGRSIGEARRTARELGLADPLTETRDAP